MTLSKSAQAERKIIRERKKIESLVRDLRVLSLYSLDECQQSAGKIAVIAGLEHPNTVRQICRRYHLPLNKSPVHTKKYVESFKYLDDAKLGYICGLIATDGNVHKKSTSIRLNLQVADRETVEFVASSLCTPPSKVKIIPPKGIGTVPQARFDHCLPLFKQYLLDLGISYNKSLSLDVNLEGKSNEFKWYFLRGAIDGDGSIHCKRSGRLCDYTIDISSASKSFLETLQKEFGGNLRMLKTGDTSLGKNPFYRLNFYGSKAHLLCEHLPKDGFTMKRKTLKINDLLTLNRHPAVLDGIVWANYNNNHNTEV